MRLSIPRSILAGTSLLVGLLILAPSAQAQNKSGVKQACTSGSAGGFSCSSVDLYAQMQLSDLTTMSDPFGNPIVDFELNDIWGWKHEASGREFLLVGRTNATAFVEVTDPLNPVFLGDLLSNYQRSNGDRNSVWRDIKVYADHAYIVADGAPGHGVQVFDLTQLLSITTPQPFLATNVYYGVSSVHNIVINEETGFGYAVGSRSGGESCGGGLHMMDLSEPSEPTFAGCFAESGTGRSGTGYTHDAQCVVYRGPDADWAGREICVNSNENAVVIADVTDKSAPISVSVGRYPATEYTHQGWLTEDHRYYFQGDELDEARGAVGETRTIVWDVTDLDQPIVIDEYFGGRNVIDHNMYVRDNLLYQSQYMDGLRILDITDPADPVEVGFFDTHPDDRSVWDGSWSNYPYLKNNVVAVTSSVDGLFLVQPSQSLITSIEPEGELPSSVEFLSFYPNPFRSQGSVELTLSQSERISIQVYDMLGRQVSTVFDGTVSAGENVRLPVRLLEGSAGMYVLRIKGETFDTTHRILRAD